jgi:putative radical SAM enzyme (TIGR03279 family)
MMNAVILRVDANSIADDLDLVAGTRVLAVNGKTDLEDLLDYRFEVTDATELTLHVQHPNGDEEIIEIEKDPDDDLGITFESPLFTPIRTCNNACPFCFIDQQPDGLRPSLYVKDDDYRLSYFSNTYITLTNLTARDKARIERLRPGPLYISVHATDVAVRRQMLKNPKAPPVMDMLHWLKSLGIPFHCQVVLCPGINDGAVLTQTLTDLLTLRPEAESVALVPVGLTLHRDALTELTPVDAATARAVIDTVTRFNQPDFIFPSDEFYFRAGLPLPQLANALPQLDDGVGTVQLLLKRFFDLEDSLPSALPAPRHMLIATGKLAAMSLQPIAQRLNAITHLHVDILPVSSQFWGQQVDVAGLLTGSDLRFALSQEPLDGYAGIVIPGVMLKQDTELFLDGVTVSQLATELGKPFTVIKDPYSAQELVTALLGCDIR